MENKNQEVVRYHREPFVQIVTNPSAEYVSVQSTESWLIRTVQYLTHVSVGDGKKAFCPFTRMIEKRNAYYAGPYVCEELEGSVAEIEACFKEISPRATHSGQVPDPTTVIAAFFEVDAMRESFCGKIEELRNQKRQHFLDQGLMIAYMHPFHALGSAKEGAVDTDRELYSSGIPLLMVRRMHKEDYVFMHTDAEKTAYARYFPGV